MVVSCRYMVLIEQYIILPRVLKLRVCPIGSIKDFIICCFILTELYYQRWTLGKVITNCGDPL
jgi:hypothetical protein